MRKHNVWKLGQKRTTDELKSILDGAEGDFVELDLHFPNDRIHLGAALGVWRMDGDKQTERLEEAIQHMIAAANFCAHLKTDDLCIHHGMVMIPRSIYENHYSAPDADYVKLTAINRDLQHQLIQARMELAELKVRHVALSKNRNWLAKRSALLRRLQTVLSTAADNQAALTNLIVETEAHDLNYPSPDDTSGLPG